MAPQGAPTTSLESVIMKNFQKLILGYFCILSLLSRGLKENFLKSVKSLKLFIRKEMLYL